MPIEDFQLKQPLGKGSFGCVSKCIRKQDQQIYAMKQIKIQKLKEKDKQNALNEIRFLASIQSPYVVSYKQAFYDEKSQNLCIIMEFADGGDIQGRIKKALTCRTRIPQHQIWKTAHNVLEGLQKMHETNILHRDIKPANIFYHKGIAKLGDLNIAKHLVDQFTVTQTGTPYYASPQVWNEQPYNFKSDIWSFGCVLYEMAMLRPPFKSTTTNLLFKKIMIGEYEKIGQPYSKQLSSFISWMLTHNQTKRPGVNELMCHSKILDMKQQFETDQNEDQMLKTIKFPQNLKSLNENLPKANYESKSKTLKFIGYEQNKLHNDNKIAKSTVRLPPPFFKSIASEKRILAVHNQIEKDKESPLIHKPKIFKTNRSQKLIV